jgi:hypothetical protein
MQPFPELQNNLGFSIGHNPHGYFMETNYPRTIQLCQFWSSVGCLHRYEVGYLGPSVHNYPKGIIDLVLGSPMMKSIAISSYFHSSTCKGYNILAGC